MKYFINNCSRKITVKGIHMVVNLDNGSIIGLSEQGRNLLEKIEAQEEIQLNQLNGEQKELLEGLIETGIISDRPYETEKTAKSDLCAAYVHITNTCNLHCLGCYSFDEKRNKAKDLSLDQLKEIFKSLTDNGLKQVIISGGEPFTRQDLPELLQYMREELQIEGICMITNGTVPIGERALDAVKKYVDRVDVSVDGYSPEQPTFIRDKGIFDKIVSTVKFLNDEGIEVTILPTLHSKNHDKLQEYDKLAQSLGVPLNFSLLSVCDSPTFKDFIFNEEQLHVVADQILNVGVKVADSPLGEDLVAEGTCGAGRYMISVGTDGSVYPCHMLHDEHFKLGNILEQPIEEILLHSDKVQQFRDINVEEIEGCNACDYRYFCMGGCRARSYFASGDIKHKDSYCASFEHFYDCVTDQLVKGLQSEE